MFAQGLAREVGDRGVTVNNLQPGPIDTDLNLAAGEWAVPQKALTALNRYGSVDDVAALLAFVAGPEASYIVGASLTADGGTNARRCLSERLPHPPLQGGAGEKDQSGVAIGAKQPQGGTRVRAFNLRRLPGEMGAKAEPADQRDSPSTGGFDRGKSQRSSRRVKNADPKINPRAK